MLLSRILLGLAVAAGGGGAYALWQQQQPRYENATSVRVTRIANAQCYDPQSGYFPCIEAFVVIVYPSQDGRLWGVSTSYKLDGLTVAAIQRDFGAAAPVALRQLEGPLAAARTDPDPRVRERAERLATQFADTRRYDIESGATVPFKVERLVDEIARAHYASTHHRLTITSGSRGPDKQARAMFDKLELGDNILALYRDQQSAREIKAAYDAGKKAGTSAGEIVAAMTAVIQAQVDRGVYISRHLRDEAVDVRISDMGPDEAADFRRQVAKSELIAVGLEETQPPHFHLELVTPELPLP
jgi:hypothetical protein